MPYNGLAMKRCRLKRYNFQIKNKMDIYPQHTNIAQDKDNDFIADVINCPDELEPVLAKIEHINSLGKSNWYEVVYYDGNWRCYSGSKTFKDGEKVVKWKYCKGCL